MDNPLIVRAFRDCVFGFTQSIACLAQIEGMKAENQQRELRGKSMAYCEDAFQVVSDTLEKIGHQLQNIVI